MVGNDLLEQLTEWLRIPSISSGLGDPADLLRAAEWARDRVLDAGGRAEVLEGEKNPLVVGELAAATSDSPTVLIYGHYDVQSADLWSSPPFEPEVRDGRLYGRGTSDDKGNFFPLLYVACELARAGELPVTIRVLVEGEEEVGGDSAVNWVLGDDRGADAAIIFDSDMLDADTLAVTLGVRGIVMVEVHVRVAPRDLHSGLYGGVVHNAAHVLSHMITSLTPDPDGLLRDELRSGRLEPTEMELEAWSKLPTGDALISESGGVALDAAAGRDYYRRNWAEPSFDVHGIATGDAVQVRTIVPGAATAKLSVRLAPGQSSATIGPELCRLLEQTAPEGVEVAARVISTGEPAVFDPKTPALRAGIAAIGRAAGTAAALVRVGGSLPVMAALAERGIPTILSGFALPPDNVHGSDESFRLESLRLCEASARELYFELAALERD